MKLKDYSDFLLESILYTSDEFKTVLSSMNDQTAKDLLLLIDKDIKTNYNILKTTDANDQISFVPDNQANMKLKSMNLTALFLAKGNTTSIGRICRSILSDNGISKTDKEMENFVNGFKAAYDKINTKEDSIKIVSGEDIRYWYSEKRYCEDTIKRLRGSLGKSCMRYSEAQDYLNIYTENKDVCKLVIQVDDQNKLVSRALLWKTIDDSLYLDRIYYTNDSDEKLLISWIKEKFKDKNVITFPYRDKCEVQLTNISDYNQYPYMDSFVYFHAGEHKLYNYEPNKGSIDRKKLFYLQETDGTADRQDNRYCEYLDESWPEEDCVWSEKLHSYLPEHTTVWSDYYDSFLYKDNAVLSTIVDDYLDSQDAIQVYTDSKRKNKVWYPSDRRYRDKYDEDQLSGHYYTKDLLIYHNGYYYLEDNTVFVYPILEESQKDYEEIYHSKYFAASNLDFKIFGFKLSEDSDVESKRGYYLNIYTNVIYKELIEKLNSIEGVDKELIDKKIEEVKEADLILRASTDFYKVNNILYEKFNHDRKKIMKEYKEIIEPKLDEFFDFMINRSGWADMIKYKEEIKYFIFNPIINEKFIGNVIQDDYNIIKEKILEKNNHLDIWELERAAYSLAGTCDGIIRRILGSTLTQFGSVLYYYLMHLRRFKQ